MSIVIGIDIGGSNTKIVGLRGGQVISPVHVKATDPVASLYGAFGRFISDNALRLSDIEKVLITGVGSKAIKESIFGISTAVVDEFLATGLGGLYTAGLERAVVVSMGTGTAFIAAEGGKVTHLGGTGVGGGTLSGLAKLVLGMTSVSNVVKLAQDGDLSKIDLKVSEITSGNIATLLPDATAANFGKLSDLATQSDKALGLVNMICQIVGMLAVFASNMTNNDTVVLTGYLSRMPQAEELFAQIEQLTGKRFLIPQFSEFATAIGAAMAYLRNNEYVDIKESI